MDITENQLIEALREALEKGAERNGDGLTAPEISDAMGISEGLTHKLLHLMKRQGKLEIIRGIQRFDLVDRPYKTHGYRFKAPEG
jgi:DNA-directed RNA polymerase specialized sigma24 family protein